MDERLRNQILAGREAEASLREISAEWALLERQDEEHAARIAAKRDLLVMRRKGLQARVSQGKAAEQQHLAARSSQYRDGLTALKNQRHEITERRERFRAEIATLPGKIVEMRSAAKSVRIHVGRDHEKAREHDAEAERLEAKLREADAGVQRCNLRLVEIDAEVSRLERERIAI